MTGDRVYETTYSNGVGAVITLNGAYAGHQTFVAGIGTGNICKYCISNDTQYEIGEGLVTAGSPDTLTRQTVYASSNGGDFENFNTGSKDVFVTIPHTDIDNIRTKLSGIDDGAKDDQTGAEIKALYEAEANTNAYTDTDKAKNDNITITQPVDLDAIESRVNALDSAIVLKGVWNASLGTFPTSTKSGESWIVSVAGIVNGISFSINDRIIALVDSASTTIYAANWHKADYTDQVLSVNGLTGSVNITHDGLSDYVVNEHIDWTTDQGATDIHPNNYVNTDTVYTHPDHTGDVTSTGDGATVIANDVVSNAKLANVATSTIKGRITAATGDPEDLTPANVRTIINVEDGATADQTGAEIKALYEAESNTNAFTDTDQTKLGNISITQPVDLDAIESRVNSLDTAIVLKGVWDASLGTFPTSTVAGESWIVSVAGTVNGIPFAINDRIIALVNGASTTIYAANWHKADYTDQVLSVNGLTGAVSITHDGLSDYVINEHIDWTTDQGATDIHPNNYVNTVYVHPNDGADPGLALTGATVFSDIEVNAAGHVIGHSTRNITLADLGYTGSPTANDYTLPVATATVIGGVQGSADITIDASGNMTIVDDSHNHIISNVDGLQAALDGKVDDSQVLTNVPAGAVFTDTVYTHPNHTGDVTSTGDGATVISNDVVTNAKLANVATSTIKGRVSPLTGDPEDLTPANVRTIINVEDGATADQTGAEIKAAYEAEANTNAFTDAEKTKVGHISVTQAVDLDTIESRVNALDSAIVLMGTWNASLGTFPTSSVAGESWIVSVAGIVDGVSFSVDDRIIALVNSASTTIYASNWHKADYTDQVLSVNGLTGAVSITHDGLSDFVANEHIDWTTDQGATDIHPNNYTDTVYTHPDHTGDVTSTGDGATVIANDVVSNAKLANMAANTIKGRQTTTGDPVDLTAPQVRTIINVEDGATADQTGAEIKALYEAEANTNAFTDAEKTLLGNQSGVNTGDQTAADIGLGNVDNTSDANKPVSTAQQAALDLKANLASITKVITTTTYTILATDVGKNLIFDNVADIAVTLPDTLDVDFQCSIIQVNTGIPTVTPVTDTVNGAGTGVAPAAQWKAMYLSQYSATNWLALL